MVTFLCSCFLDVFCFLFSHDTNAVLMVHASFKLWWPKTPQKPSRLKLPCVLLIRKYPFYTELTKCVASGTFSSSDRACTTFLVLYQQQSRNKVLCSNLTSSLPLFSQGGWTSWVTICNQSRTKALQPPLPSGIGRTKPFLHHDELQVVWLRKEERPLPNTSKLGHWHGEEECLMGL